MAAGNRVGHLIRECQRQAGARWGPVQNQVLGQGPMATPMLRLLAVLAEKRHLVRPPDWASLDWCPVRVPRHRSRAPLACLSRWPRSLRKCREKGWLRPGSDSRVARSRIAAWAVLLGGSGMHGSSARQQGFDCYLIVNRASLCAVLSILRILMTTLF